MSSGVTSIAAGSRFNVVVKNGNVFAWGTNSNGQLGDGTSVYESLVPEEIDPTDLHNIVQVSTGDIGYSCVYALSADGTIWDWGDDSAAELGIYPNSLQYNTPQHLLPPAGYVFTSVSARADGAIALIAPIPEPATVGLLCMGAVASLVGRRRWPRI